MRIYDLDESLDKLIKTDKYQVEFIGELGYWQCVLSTTEWNDDTGMFDYEVLLKGTAPTFLGAYDMVVEKIFEWENRE